MTGASGFVGSAVVRRLVERGATSVRCMTRETSNLARLRAIAAEFPNAPLSFVEADLTARGSANDAVRGVDVVVHAAAAMGGAPADMFLHTVVGSKYLLEAIGASPRSPRVVLVSSMSVYGTASLGRSAIIDEASPVEANPERRDVYAQTKILQERLFFAQQRAAGLPLVVLRPGVIYGPGGAALSTRVGLNVFGLFLSLGGANALPLTHVSNCADAVVLAVENPSAVGQVFNVCDDELPTCRQYLASYKKGVRPLRSVSIPYPMLQKLSRMVAWYHETSRGQLPAVLTPYKVAALWGGNRFTNGKLKALGWRPAIPVSEGLFGAFEALRASGT